MKAAVLVKNKSKLKIINDLTPPLKKGQLLIKLNILVFVIAN